MRQKRRRIQRALPSSTRLPALAGLCGIFALSGPILAAELAPVPATPVKFRVNVPKDDKNTVPVNGFVFEGGAFNPSYSPPPQPRAMPTAMTVNAAASTAPVEVAPVTPPPAPRETPTAPRVKLEEPSPKPRGKAPKPEPEPERKRPVHHHVEEGHTAPAPHHYDGKEYVGKEAKPVLPLEIAESPFHFSGSAGYYSKYMFRGLDVGYRTGIDDGNDSAFFSTQAAMAYKGFALGVGFIESLDPYIQRGSAFNNDFGRGKATDFRSPSKERYKEYDLFANYTYQFTDTLALTAGMNFYWFGDGRSWANQGDDVSNTMETAVSLTYTGLPWVNQSLSYYYDFDAFKGSYLEYKIAAKPIKVFEEGSFAINIIPSATLSVDFRYNGTNNGWNGFEPGLDVPIQITDGLVLNLGARYNMDLGSGSGNGNGGVADRTDDRFWFSAAVQYSFPNRGWNPFSPTTTAYDKDGKSLKDKIVYEEPYRPWSIAVGAGVRSISSDFQLRASPMNSIADRISLGGSTRRAVNSDESYSDGAVYAGTGAYADGTSSFSFHSQSQVTTPRDSGDSRQVSYHSERFLAADAKGIASNHNDDDEPIYPYLTASREIWHQDKFHLGIGLGYQYARSETDSGYRISGLAKNTAYTFTYDIDELTSTALNDPQAPFNNRAISPRANLQPAGQDYYLITNAQQYQTTYQGLINGLTVPLAPSQRDEQNTRSLAAFKRATLDTDLHSLSIPIDFKVDLAPRVHLGVSFGPTFNLFDLNLETETYYQLVDVDQSSPSAKTHRSPYNTAGQPVNIPGPGKPAVPAGGGVFPQGGAVARAGGPNPQGAATNAKGAQGAKSRNLPGENVAHSTSSRDSQEFKLGLFAQASLSVDLDAAKRWYVEVYARYDYVPEFTVSDGSSSAVVDASSLGGGVGLGFRF